MHLFAPQFLLFEAVLGGKRIEKQGVGERMGCVQHFRGHRKFYVVWGFRDLKVWWNGHIGCKSRMVESQIWESRDCLYRSFTAFLFNLIVSRCPSVRQ